MSTCHGCCKPDVEKIPCIKYLLCEHQSVAMSVGGGLSALHLAILSRSGISYHAANEFHPRLFATTALHHYRTKGCCFLQVLPFQTFVLTWHSLYLLLSTPNNTANILNYLHYDMLSLLYISFMNPL